MSEALSNLPVNQHYLDKVMDLAEEMDVAATEDIFDSRGMKLVAKGAKISKNLQEKLILHKLKKPLEKSIAVEGGVDTNALVTEAKRIQETILPVKNILDAVSSNGFSPVELLSKLKFGDAMKLMLTITERGGESALAHSVMVSMVSICLAKKLGLNESEQITAALAGLLHDIGELYIQPEYLNSKKRLLPHEWRHVVVHPRIGQMLISELENFPPAVAQAVAEHHERFDGTGYPRQIAGKEISFAGQAVSVSEMISGVFMRQDRPLQRAELALKIIPGEHAHELVSVVSSVLRSKVQDTSGSLSLMTADETRKNIHSLFDQISAVQEMGRGLMESTKLRSKIGKELLLQVLNQTNVIKRAVCSTGLDLCLNDLTGEGDALDGYNIEILFEAGVATREIQWRLRDVARHLALNATRLEMHESDIFEPLIKMFDEGCG